MADFEDDDLPEFDGMGDEVDEDEDEDEEDDFDDEFWDDEDDEDEDDDTDYDDEIGEEEDTDEIEELPDSVLNNPLGDMEVSQVRKRDLDAVKEIGKK